MLAQLREPLLREREALIGGWTRLTAAQMRLRKRQQAIRERERELELRPAKVPADA
jgi:hypothetical protein